MKLVEAGGIEPPSKTVGPTVTTSVSPLLYLNGCLCGGCLAPHPVRLVSLSLLRTEALIASRTLLHPGQFQPARNCRTRCNLGSVGEVVIVRVYFFAAFNEASGASARN